MKILLLGGSGFIGNALSIHLRAQQHEVLTVSTSKSANLRLNLAVPNTIETVLSSTPFDTVVNLAGTGLDSGTADVNAMIRINTELPARILEAIKISTGTHKTHLIHASSSTERLPGQTADESFYSQTKALGTSRLKMEFQRAPFSELSSKMNLTICRIHNTYGPRQPHGRFIAHVTKQLLAEEPVRLTYPSRIRDFVFLDDTVSGLALLVEAGQSAPAEAELGSGVGFTLHDAALKLAALLKKPEDLILLNPQLAEDPNPVTVAAQEYGSLGNCRTSFEIGLEQTLKEN
jgi:nucleoside-diphosphate-sugar epimerase